jgi:hypothetical protein
MGFSVEKHLKIDKPLCTIYLSHTPHPIKVVNTAPSETTRANKIAIKNAETSKVTASAAVMSIFSEKTFQFQSANRRNEKPSGQKAERANFPEENTRRPRNLSQKLRKGRLLTKLASKLKK